MDVLDEGASLFDPANERVLLSRVAALAVFLIPGLNPSTDSLEKGSSSLNGSGDWLLMTSLPVPDTDGAGSCDQSGDRSCGGVCGSGDFGPLLDPLMEPSGDSISADDADSLLLACCALLLVFLFLLGGGTGVLSSSSPPPVATPVASALPGAAAVCTGVAPSLELDPCDL